MNIIITKNDWVGGEIYESDRITMHGGSINEEIIKKAIEWLNTKER